MDRFGSRAAVGWVLLSTLLVGGCGQIGQGRRGDVLAASPASAARGEVTGPLTIPNGENSGPEEGAQYRHIVTVTRKVTVFKNARGVLKTCPVRGRGFFSDDFGYPRFAGGYHPHQGNDVFAGEGTPIVAPFDGLAVAVPNVLGGLAVNVVGPSGYVYNAHLSRYGKLGRVASGDVVGYVGNTGDAAGGPPHDHFEFHPNGGPAVDPYPYLVAACT